MDDEGTLTIFGTGGMRSYSQWEGRPEIKKVVIEEGVTDISTEAFDNCDNLTSVSIPSSVTSIGVCTVCGGEDPDYVAPEKPSDPAEPTEPGEEKEKGTNAFMVILNAILEALAAFLALFGIKI